MRESFTCALTFGVAFALALATETEAHACGVSGVGGQAGVACALDLPEEWRASVAYTYTTTALSFTGDRRADVTRHAVATSLAVPIGKKLVVEGALGGLPVGTLQMNGVDYTYNPSFLAAASLTYRALPEGKYAPFVLGTLTFAGLFGSTSSHSTSTQDFTALDLRAGISAGKHVTEHLSLFGVGRVFGGPIWWRAEGESITGTDKYHYQLGVGGAYAIGAALLFVEGIPLGEQAITAGFGAAI